MNDPEPDFSLTLGRGVLICIVVALTANPHFWRFMERLFSP